MLTSSRRVFFAMLAIAAATARAAADPPQGFALNEAPQPVPEIGFADGDAKPKTLADFRGKVVLLNLWATWCLPCRKEMPTLDRLQAELGGPDFEVVALSMDRKGPDAVRKFFTEVGIRHLALNIDASSKAMFTLGAFGLPLTLLIDREGHEIGRLIGPAEWDSPDMVEFIRGRIAGD
jgi:thiol-disulfide isomerase/thioredoxin